MAHRSEADLLAERDLILAAQRDRAAFAPLYERYVDRIFAYALTLTQNRELAEDVTAATFAKALEELPRFEWRGVPYSAWLYRVASNLVARSKRRPGWIELDARLATDDDGPVESLERHSREEEVRTAVAALPEDTERDAADIRPGRSHLNGCYTGNDGGRSYGDVQLVGSSVDGLKDVLAPDVGVRRAGSDDAEEQGKDEAKRSRSELHRCTLRIQRPKLKPIRALMEA